MCIPPRKKKLRVLWGRQKCARRSVGCARRNRSSHIDTFFPAGTPLNIRQQGTRLYGPGVSDNGAGVTAMLGIIALLRSLRMRHSLPFLFIGNVGEEGEGDLRGMRHIFATPRWKDS